MSDAERVFKMGFAPVISTKGLKALRTACLTDDKRLVQGSTTTPPPLMCVQDWPCEGGCGVGYCGWAQMEYTATVGEVQEYFAAKCFQADQLLGEPAARRWMLNWFDETPRLEMLATLAEWTQAVLADRKTQAEQAADDAEAERLSEAASTAFTDLF